MMVGKKELFFGPIAEKLLLVLFLSVGFFIYLFFIYEEKARTLCFQAGRSLATRSSMSDLRVSQL